MEGVILFRQAEEAGPPVIGATGAGPGPGLVE